jgi:hypothetical protein
VGWHEWGGGIRKGVGGEYGGNIVYSCMKMEKQDLLKLLQEWGKRGNKGE